MQVKKRLYLRLGILAAGTLFTILPTIAREPAVTPDALLLDSKGRPWWFRTKPSPSPVTLRSGTPTPSEETVIAKARALMAVSPNARALALVDGDKVLFTEFHPPAGADSLFLGQSMGKTVTALAVGKAICQGHLGFETKVADLMPELRGAALGIATVRDLLRMASGSADSITSDSSMWSGLEQRRDFFAGRLNLIDLLSEDRNSRAARGVFSDFKPGESFSYKATDPLMLGMMTSRATKRQWAQWVQESVLDPMGVAGEGIYDQDRQKNGHSSAGMRLQLQDWIRLGLYIKRSSKEPGCFGEFVRAAISTQISNTGTRKTRKHGAWFGGYGYLLWTENETAPDSTWLAGYGGQRIGIDLKSNRQVIVFSTSEEWIPDVYAIARDWHRLGQ